MRYSAGVKFKSMEVALKEMERYVRGGIDLQSGRGFKQFGDMRPREVWANWLLCAVINAICKNSKLEFSTDPTGGDGVILDQVTKKWWLTEHVFVPKQDTIGDKCGTEGLILDAIKHKQAKGGEAYAAGKILIVFLDGGTKWFPNKVAQKLPNPLLFKEVWVIALQAVENDAYEYCVVPLDISCGNAPTHLVRINSGFNSWEVVVYQEWYSMRIWGQIVIA